MKIKVLTEWIDKKMKNYNAFIPEEDDYEDEDDAPNDPVIVLKHQRYATRLYTIVFIGKYIKYTHQRLDRIVFFWFRFDLILNRG